MLVAAVLVAAPFIWLHQKIGTGGIILLIGGIIVLLAINSYLKRPKRSANRQKPSRGRSSPNRTTISIPADKVGDILSALDRMDMTDYLGMAATAGQKAKAAADAGDFDDAWRHYHEQKAHYINHANRSEFTPAQAIALEGSVNRSLANILRLEGRHSEALVHILYYYATTPKRTKTDEKQLLAYYNRSKIKAVEIDEVRAFAENLGPVPNFRSIQAACSQWLTAA